MRILGMGCKHNWSPWEYFTGNVDNYEALTNRYLFSHTQLYRIRACKTCCLVKVKRG